MRQPPSIPTISPAEHLDLALKAANFHRLRADALETELKDEVDLNSTLTRVLRRAVDRLAFLSDDGSREIEKILADNGLHWDSAGHLVKRE